MENQKNSIWRHRQPALRKDAFHTMIYTILSTVGLLFDEKKTKRSSVSEPLEFFVAEQIISSREDSKVRKAVLLCTKFLLIIYFI